MSRRCFLLSVLALAACLPTVRLAADEKPATIRIAVYADKGTSRSIRNVLRALGSSDRFSATKVSADDVRNGKLKNFDVVVHPGGSGGGQGRALQKEGREAVRSFVKGGGGYVGFCAGAYLATNDYSWSLGILDAKVVDKKHWARGYGDVKLRLTKPGQTFFGRDGEIMSIYYHQGPLLAPNGAADVPDYETLADFETEVSKKGVPSGVMKGATAVCRGQFGRGRVFCFSPHPEKTKELDDVVHRAMLWAASRAE